MRKQVALINWGVRVTDALKSCILALVCCALAVATSPAQTISGRIAGVITDQTGGVIAKAAITVTSEDTGVVRRAKANEDGFYVAPELPVGYYTLKVEGGGFAPATLTRVKVDVGAETRLNIKLALQATQVEVSVSAPTPTLQSDSALAEVIDNKQVDALPLNGRDFRRLTTIVLGSAPRTQRGALGTFTINGQREKTNIFLIDGVDNNDSFRNAPSFNQGGVTGAIATVIPIGALTEFNIQTQGPAEYGRNAGATVNIVVKSGTNQYHGSAYDFLRNDQFDARNFFERCPASSPNCDGGGKQEFRNNNFGGVVGGPIIKNRTFFFGGYEGQREFVFSPGLVRVPSAADIAAARAINAAAGLAENSLSTGILQLFPTANSGAATGPNYSFAAPNTNNSDNALLKIDQYFGDRFHLSGRYIFGDGSQTFPLTALGGSPLPAYQTVVPTRIQLFGLNLATVLSPRLINESRLAYNRFFQTFNPLDANFDPASIGLVTGAKSLPTIIITGFVSLGAPPNVPRGRVSSGYQVVDNLTWTAGAHVFKTGGEYRRAIVNAFSDTLARGQLNFTSLANFLAGTVSPTGTGILRGSTRRDTFTNNFGLFAQDDWKVTQRLTLNFGLRYEYLGLLKEENDRLSNFIPGTGLLPVGAGGLSDLYRPDRNNFAPRLGFAYDVTGKGRTVLRGAYGLYYDTPSQDYFLSQGFSNLGPGSPAVNPLPGLGVFNVTFGPSAIIPYGPNVPIFGNAQGVAPTSNIALYAVDQNLRTPYIQNFNLNVQQEIRPGMALQVGYVGSRGTKLFRVRDINQASPGVYVNTAAREATRPFSGQFPQFSFINYLAASANSNYNSLQAFLRQRLARGLNFTAGYTWSKSIDDASNGIYSGIRGVSFPQDSFNVAAERAVSTFDSRHRFTGNFTYDLDFLTSLRGGLPKRLTEGWQMSGIFTAQSGLPITPFTSADVSGTGELNDRPNLVGDPTAGARRDAASWFNTAAFAVPAPGTFGNAGRNTVIGPRLYIVDLSMSKTTKINERLSGQFRAEFFNLLNQANLSLPQVDFNNRSTFGTITDTPDVTLSNPRLGEGGPRVIQFVMKLIF
jgi:hypothetical protein